MQKYINYFSVFLITVLVLGGVSEATAQSKVRAKDLRGVWKMEINLKAEAETAGERVLLNAIDGLIDEVDIYMEFLPDNRLLITTDSFGDIEEEEGEWHINKSGELVLGDTDKFSSDDTFWLLKRGRLIAYEYEKGKRKAKNKGKTVYIRKVKN